MKSKENHLQGNFLLISIDLLLIFFIRKGKDDLIDFNILGLEDNRNEKNDNETFLDGRSRSKSKEGKISSSDRSIREDYGNENDDDDDVKLNVMQSPFPARVNNTNVVVTDDENNLSPMKSSDIFSKSVIDSEPLNYPDKVNNITNEDIEKKSTKSEVTNTETESGNLDGGHDKKKKTNSIYYRIVGKRKQASAQGVTKICDDPEASLSTVSNLKDKFWSFMAGESELERMTRLRLQWYKGLLQSELIVVERAKIHHRQHGQNLAQDFENQELQLQKWGLLNILPAFRMQAWARVSRASLLEDMSIIATRLLQARYDRAGRVISQFNDSSVSRKYPLSSYN